MGMLISDWTGKWELDLPGHFNGMEHDSLLVCEKTEKISFDFGEMEFTQIFLPDIYIVHGDMMMRQEHFRISASEMPEMVELHFTLAGWGKVKNQASGKSYHFLPNQHNIMYIPEFDALAEYPVNSHHKFLEIHLSKSYFLQQTQNTNPVLERFAAHVAGEKKEAMISNESSQVTFEMHQCLGEIMNCRFKGGLKLAYLQAKCMELLILQAEAFEKDHDAPHKSVLKNASDKERIHYAKDYLLENMSSPPSLTKLAVLAGTNTFKLKNGFKELFGTTVFGYLNEVKLVQAKEMLCSGSQIKEVADVMGYSSVQHFSTAFRKKFKTSPGKVK